MKSENFSPARLEAFSDGVIAVIITIMVLELKVPSVDGWAGVRVVAPTVFLYLLSFVQIGIYWVNHHYLIDEVKTVSHGVLWANLLFLFFLSLFPLATDWIGTRGLSAFSTALYAGVSFLPGLAYSVLWTSVRSHRVDRPHASRGKQIFSMVMYLSAMPLAFYSRGLALTMIGVVAATWVLPPAGDGANSET